MPRDKRHTRPVVTRAASPNSHAFNGTSTALQKLIYAPRLTLSGRLGRRNVWSNEPFLLHTGTLAARHVRRVYYHSPVS
jgi:hypothetical protein